MSRLYYEKPKFTPADKNLKGTDATPPPTPPNNSGILEYLNKVATLVPSEIIAGCLAMQGFAGTITEPKQHGFYIWAVFAFGLILTPLYLNKVADKGRPKTRHLILSAFAFVVWSYVTSGEALQATITDMHYYPAFASGLLIAFSIASALIPLDE